MVKIGLKQQFMIINPLNFLNYETSSSSRSQNSQVSPLTWRLHVLIMECKKPILVGKVRSKQRLVPCGKCAQCKANLRAEWCGRLAVENYHTKRSYFVTLTYSDENLKFSNQGVPSVWKHHIQKFLKRVRKVIKCRYFCTSEYGSKTQRPHYHIIFFLEEDMEVLDFGNLMERKWTNGIIHLGDVTPASIAYCTKYCMKEQKAYPFGANPPFRLMSKVPPLGYQLNLDERTCGSFDFFGQKFKTARLYRDKFYNSNDLGEALKVLAETRQAQRQQARFAAWCRKNNKDINTMDSKIEYGLWLEQKKQSAHELHLKHIKEEIL